jgi:predicted dienelactone hydrolase
MALAATVLTACSPPPPSADASTAIDAASIADAAPDESSPSDAAQTDASSGDAALSGDAGPINGCSPSDRAACAYGPTMPRAVTPATQELTYMDATGATRTIRVAVYVPPGLTGPTPVVLWSHGGADGSNNPVASGDGWATVFSAAQYISVHIAHAPRTAAERTALCNSIGFDATGCTMFKHLSWDRPHDVRRVLDWVEEQARGRFADRIDPRRIAYAGHSAGAGGVLMVAGATRDFAGTQRAISDPRPIAFISCSPQGPGEDGFIESSFAPVTRPHMTLTGLGDETSGVLPESRRRPFELVQPGDKYRLWINEASARHTTFDFNTDACESYQRMHSGDLSRCSEYRRWLASAMLAFLDAHLRNAAPARAWLSSTNAAVLSAGVIEWSRR